MLRGNRKIRGVISAKHMTRMKVQVFFWAIPQFILYPRPHTYKKIINIEFKNARMCVIRCYCENAFLIQSGARTVVAGSSSLVLSQDKSQSPCSCFTRPSRILCQFLWPKLLLASFICSSTLASCCQVFQEYSLLRAFGNLLLLSGRLLPWIMYKDPFLTCHNALQDTFSNSLFWSVFFSL